MSHGLLAERRSGFSNDSSNLLCVYVKAELILLLRHWGTRLVREAFSCSRNEGVGGRCFEFVKGRERSKGRRTLGTAAILLLD